MNVRSIAEFLAASFEGDGNAELTGLASSDKADRSDLSFFVGEGPVKTHAGAVICRPGTVVDGAQAIIRAANPKLEFARASVLIRKSSTLPRTIHSNAIVSASARIGDSFVGPGVTIDAGVSIEDECEIHAGCAIGEGVRICTGSVVYPNVTIYPGVKIGSRCVIHAGTVIGSAGYGYVTDDAGRHHQFPQIGTVEIGDEVDIGSNCTIDGGSLGITTIGRGTKIDNLVHIAHNVTIGENVLIAGQSGIAGSSTIESGVIIAGQVGISDHVTIRSGAIIGAKSAVYPNKIVGKGFWVGIPARPLKRFLNEGSGRELRKLRQEVDELRERLDKLAR